MVDVTDGRYLSLVRELANVTREGCDADCRFHIRDAANHINAFLKHPELLWKLRTVANGAAPRTHENPLRQQLPEESSDS